MPHIDEFWDEIADEGLVDFDQAGRARARFIQIGGGLDTAVLENAPLGPGERRKLLEIAARVLEKKLARPMAISQPDRDAIQHIPRAVIDRYGVMPARDDQGRLVLICPPLAPHVFNELKVRLGRSFDARLALEMDLRLALAWHFDVPLPSRFEALRSGRQPGRSALSGVPAHRPVRKRPAPTPRPSTDGEARAWLGRASAALRLARDPATLVELLATAGADVLDGRFYLLADGRDAVRCVGGTGLTGAGPTVALTPGGRLEQALRIGTSRLEDFPRDPDLGVLYAALDRPPPARVMVEPIRDGLEIIGVFVGDHGAAGIDRTVVGTLRRWLSRVSMRLADLRQSGPPPPAPSARGRARPESLPPVPDAIEGRPPRPPSDPPTPSRRASEPPVPPPVNTGPTPAGVPPRDPFAPERRRRRSSSPAAALMDLAEAARAAAATADPMPPPSEPPPPRARRASAEPPPRRPSAELDPEPPPPPPVAAPGEPPAVDAPRPPAPSAAPGTPPPADDALDSYARPTIDARPPPMDPALDLGEPDGDDPLADFLADPELEAVGEALFPDAHRRLDTDLPMGRPPNTLPERPRARGDERPGGSIFASLTPAIGAPGEVGGPPPTRPNRPGAIEDVADAPRPTVNLRPPPTDAPRVPDPLGTAPPVEVFDLDDDAVIEVESDPPRPPPVPIRRLRGRKPTVDLTPPEGDDDAAFDPPPFEVDPAAMRARKTVNLRPPAAESPLAHPAVVIHDETPGDGHRTPRVDVWAETAELPVDPDLDDVGLEIDPSERDTDAIVIDAGAGLDVEGEADAGELDLDMAAGDDVVEVPIAPSAPPGEADAGAESGAGVGGEPDASADADDADATVDPEASAEPEASADAEDAATTPDPEARADAEPTAGSDAEPDEAPSDGPDADPAAAVGAVAEASPDAEPHSDGERADADAIADAPTSSAPPEATPPAAAESTPPAAAPESTPPVDAAESTPPVDAAESTPPVDAAESTLPASAPESTPPASAPESTPPAAAPESTPPAAAPESTPPAAAAGSTPPAAALESTAPAAAPESTPPAAGSASTPPAASTPPSAAPSSSPPPVAAAESTPPAPIGYAAASARAQSSDPPLPLDEIGAPAALDSTPPARARRRGASDNDLFARAMRDLDGGGSVPSPEPAPRTAPSTPRFARGGRAEDVDLDLDDADDSVEDQLDRALDGVGDADEPIDLGRVHLELERSVTEAAGADAEPSPEDSLDDALLDLGLGRAPRDAAPLALDGRTDEGIDLDLDLGLGLDAPAAAAEASPAAASPVAPAAPPPDPEELDAQVRALGDPERADDAEEALYAAGEAGLDALFRAFPGQLVVDRYTDGDTVPVEQHSRVLRAIARFGDAAGPRLAARCEHLAPDVRYYAVYMFTAVRHLPSVAAITPCLTDSDGSVRAIAVRVAHVFRRDDIFSALVTYLVSLVERGRLADRRAAAETLGHLHASAAAPSLIAMLGAPQPPLRDAAHRALVEIARQDVGHDVWRWRTFFERNADRPRVEWLLDGLLSDKRAIRLGAFRELRRLTHLNFGYVPDAPPDARRAAVAAWTRWWQQTGHEQYGDLT